MEKSTPTMPWKFVKTLLCTFLRLNSGSLQRTVLPIILADTVISLGPCHARSVNEEDVLGPDDCILQGRLKNSETLDILDSLLAHLSVDGRKEMVGLICFLMYKRKRT